MTADILPLHCHPPTPARCSVSLLQISLDILLHVRTVCRAAPLHLQHTDRQSDRQASRRFMSNCLHRHLHTTNHRIGFLVALILDPTRHRERSVAVAEVGSVFQRTLRWKTARPSLPSLVVLRETAQTRAQRGSSREQMFTQMCDFFPAPGGLPGSQHPSWPLTRS